LSRHLSRCSSVTERMSSVPTCSIMLSKKRRAWRVVAAGLTNDDFARLENGAIDGEQQHREASRRNLCPALGQMILDGLRVQVAQVLKLRSDGPVLALDLMLQGATALRHDGVPEEGMRHDRFPRAIASACSRVNSRTPSRTLSKTDW